MNDDHPVARDRAVELETGYAERERARKSGQGILGREAARTAMAQQIDNP
jgi:hypothetical protein